MRITAGSLLPPPPPPPSPPPLLLLSLHHTRVGAAGAGADDAGAGGKARTVQVSHWMSAAAVPWNREGKSKEN